MSTTKDMTEGKPFGLIFSFAIPFMLSSMLQQLYSVVDSAVVGHLIGVNAFAAVGATGFLTWMIISIILGLTQGFGIFFAQRFGAGDLPGLRKGIASAIKITLLAGVLMTIVSIVVARPVMQLLHTPEEILSDALVFIYWMFGGILITFFYNLSGSVLRALGNSKTPLLGMVISSVLNIALDVIFIAVFGMGIGGAALATVLSWAFAFLYCVVKLRTIPEVQLSKGDFASNPTGRKELLRLGMPLAFRNGVIAVGGLVIQYAINGYGTLFVAGTTAAKKYFGMMEIVAYGLDGALATFASQNFGKGNYKRVKEGMRMVRRISIISSLVIAGIFLLFGRFFIGILVTGNPEEIAQIKEIGYRNMVGMAFCLLPLYMLYIHRSGLQAMGKTFVPMISGFIELGLRMVSVLLLPVFIGRWGVYLADGIGWIGAALLLMVSYSYLERKLLAESNKEKQSQRGK